VDLDEAAVQWRNEGFVILPSYLSPTDLEDAQNDLHVLFPSARDFHDDVDPERNAKYRGDEFAALVLFPFDAPSISMLAVHPKIVAFAEAAFGTEDIRIYNAEAWAKYAGAADYEQEHHRDYLNHTPLVPTDDWRFRGLEMFLWLSDVTDSNGPTHLVPRSVTSSLPALPHGYSPEERSELYDAEVSAAGPAGTLVAYSTETFHRGTAITDPRGVRFSLHLSYRQVDNFWTNRVGWGDRSYDPHWNPFVERASLRQLLLFGFPPPDHPYWTPATRAGMAIRYEGMDLSSW